MVYDWARRSPMLVSARTFQRTDASWAQIDSQSSTQPVALAFDPELPGLVASRAGELCSLASNASEWTCAGRVSTVIGTSAVTSFAYDRTSGRMLATGSDGTVRERQAGTWTRSPVPLQPGYRLLPDERRGIALALPLDGSDTAVLERRASGFVAAEQLPLPVVGRAAYEPVHGRVVIAGDGVPNSPDAPGYTFLLVRTLASDGPDETCAATDDDGDGLVACDDPDCYWACAGCSPYTSCVALPSAR
jgi:hypothetical protein